MKIVCIIVAAFALIGCFRTYENQSSELNVKIRNHTITYNSDTIDFVFVNNSNQKLLVAFDFFNFKRFYDRIIEDSLQAIVNTYNDSGQLIKPSFADVWFSDSISSVFWDKRFEKDIQDSILLGRYKSSGNSKEWILNREYIKNNLHIIEAKDSMSFKVPIHFEKNYRFFADNDQGFMPNDSVKYIDIIVQTDKNYIKSHLLKKEIDSLKKEKIKIIDINAIISNKRVVMKKSIFD